MAVLFLVLCLVWALLPFGVFILKVVKVDTLSEFLVFGVLYVLVFIVSVWLLAMNSFEKKLIKEPIGRVLKKLFRKGEKNNAS